MSASPARTFTYAVILPHFTDSSVVLQRSENGWALPHWDTTESRSWADTGYVNRTVAVRLGTRVTTLRCLPHDPSPPENPIRRVYVLENHDPQWRPPLDCRWATADDLTSLPPAASWHADVARGWLADSGARDVPPARAPWAFRGWFAEAAAWLAAQLSAQGMPLTGPVQQERAWSISCILRAPTGTGDFYLKASAHMFAQEAGITAYLAALFPRHIPDVLAADTSRSWLAMRDFGGERLADVPDISRWEEAARLLARLQLESVNRTDDLFAVGCPDRRPAALARQLDPLLEYAASTGRRARTALSDAELDALARHLPQLRTLCADLEASGIPPTLVHGDFHADNVVAADDLVIFDWSDGCVAHPFLDLLPLLTFRRLPNGPAARERIITAYLNAWTPYGSLDHLRETFARAELLAALHQAVSYWRILAGVEAAAVWEWEADLPYFLRLVLKS